MFPYLAMTLKTVICLVTVSVSFLIFPQEFYLIKIYHGRPKFTCTWKIRPLDTSGSRKSKRDCILKYI